MIHTAKQQTNYYILNQTLVDPDKAMKHREIISENVYTKNGLNLFTITFKQILQDFGIQNWNGRTYKDAIVINGLNTNPLIQHDLKMGTWTGEYGHPIIEKGMNEFTRQMTIFPPNSCWTINKYWQEGNLLMGECTTLSGGYGDMVRDRILTKYPAMASFRSMGGVDKSGNVLPGYTPITVDCVVRPSHKVAYMVKGTEQVNTFDVPSGNTMNETAIPLDVTRDESIKNFLLSESTTRQQIDVLCNAFHIDYDAIAIVENSVVMTQSNELETKKVIIPINKMVNAEYYNLFK